MKKVNIKDKKILINEFKENENNNNLLKRLNRVVITGSLAGIIGIVLLIIAIFQKGNLFDYIYASVLLLAAIIFNISSYMIKTKLLKEFHEKKKSI